MEIPCRRVQGEPVANGEEQIGSTMPMPSFARKPSQWILSPAEISQNSMADQQKLQFSELHFDKFPTPSTFSFWKMTLKTQVSSCSDFHSGAMLWIKEVEMVDSVDELLSSRSVKCTHFPNLEMLDARIASALNKIIQNSHFKKKRSVWRNRKLRKRICSFAEGRSLT